MIKKQYAIVNFLTLYKTKHFTLLHIEAVSDHTVVKCSSVDESIFLKVALQILGRKFYKNTELSSLYSQNLLVFIHNTLVVESHPTTREIRDLLWPNGKHGLFLHEQLAHLHTENTQTKLQT